MVTMVNQDPQVKEVPKDMQVTKDHAATKVLLVPPEITVLKDHQGQLDLAVRMVLLVHVVKKVLMVQKV